MPPQPPPDQRQQAGPVPVQVYQPAFSAGELSPKLQFRSDLAKWRGGAAKLRNMFVHVQGGASNRPGTQYIGTVKDSANPPRLIPFSFNLTQTYVLEFGNAYIRFISDGTYVMSGGAPYEIATPYAIADVPLIKYTQSADVLTLTHPTYPPATLNRLGVADWTYTPIAFGASLAGPASVTVTPTAGTAGSAPAPGIPQVPYAYAVTAVSASADSESPATAGNAIVNYNIQFFQTYGNFNTVTWTPVTGASSYNIYKLDNGIIAFIGSTAALTFTDDNIAPDDSTTPPNNFNPFTGAGTYPGCVSYFQQRLVFAGSDDNPQTLWLTQSGNYNSMNSSTPPRDNDAIELTIAANEINSIKHLISIADLIVMTYGACWKISAGEQSAALTPSATTATPQVFQGCSDVIPLKIGYDILYVEAKGSYVRDLAYNFYVNLYTGTDISVMSEHFFYGYNITQWAWAYSPFKLVWAIRSDGALLSLTYLAEQDVKAWAMHTTVNGIFLSVAVAAETNYGFVEDVPYFVVQRIINGQTVCYVERMHTRLLGPANDDPTQAWFVDCGLQYSGAPVTTVSGLTQLIGESVVALADGVPVLGLTVSGEGTVTLPTAASTVTVGLPYAGELQTLPLDLGQPSVFGTRKRISRFVIPMENTRGLQVSTDGVRFVTMNNPPDPAPPGLTTGIQIVIPPALWDDAGQVTIVQDNPLPCTILGIEPMIEVGEQ